MKSDDPDDSVPIHPSMAKKASHEVKETSQEEEKRCLLKWGSSFQLLYGIRRLLVLTSTESMFVSSESSSDGDRYCDWFIIIARTPLSVDLCLFLLSLPHCLLLLYRSLLS